MKRHLYSVILGAVAALVLWAFASYGIVDKYVEDFTTTQYKDNLNTTAWWDTVSGALKLHRFELTVAGSYYTPTAGANTVAVTGNYAFVTDGTFGLQVFDISDPANPTLAGNYSMPAVPYGVTVDGNYAYVADGYAGLQVININNPASPVLAGSYDTPGRAHNVAVSGNYAYVADEDSGLQVINIASPTSPALAGRYFSDVSPYFYDVAVAGDFAYVAADYQLEIIDVSAPSNPDSAGTYSTSGMAQGVSISGNYAYLLNMGSGIEVVDISDPTNPTFTAVYYTPGSAEGLAVEGDHVFVAAGDSLVMVDVSDPTNPRGAGSCQTPDMAWGVAIDGDKAYVAAGLYFVTVEVADQRDPLLFAGTFDTPGTAYGVSTDGDHAFVADGTSGLRVIDISSPASPTEAGYYNTPGTAYGVAIEGDYVYVADYNQGFRVIDVGDPTSPTSVGSYAAGGFQLNGIAVSGNNAYLSDYTYGLRRFNITNPASPSYTGIYTYTGNPAAYGVAVSGDYAYIAYGPVGLVKVDISTGLSYVGRCGASHDARGVAVSWYYAYVADGTYGLQVADVRDLSAVGNYNTPGTAYGVAVSGDYAFVADGSSGLHVIDITNPASPTLLRSYDTPADAQGVAVSGDYAFVADGSSGLHVIKVFERGFEIGDNEARSLALDESDETIASVKVTTSQTDSIRWELSTDGGANWQDVAPDGNMFSITAPGNDLMWRSTHIQIPPYTGNPTCTGLEIEWLYERAVIDSILDIPNDQGRQVRITWARSGNDFVGSSRPIMEYAVYRKIDSGLSAITGFTGLGKEGLDKKTSPGDAGLALLYPPGDWDFMLTVPADCEETYSAVVPTLRDSSVAEGMYYTTFFVRARTGTPGTYFDSYPDSGYSVDNLAPGVPDGFAVAYNTGSGNQLSWEESLEEDFQYFRVYRETSPDFVPAPGNLQHMTIDTNWLDPVSEGWKYYYKVTAVDFSGNESDPTSTGSATAVGESVIPRVFALYQNVPNPFNPATVIRYDVPAGGGEVGLRIYDVSGRLVRTLVNGTEGPGEKTATWDGRNDRGHKVATGVYFYRITSKTFTKTRKMLLMK